MQFPVQFPLLPFMIFPFEIGINRLIDFFPIASIRASVCGLLVVVE